MIFIADLNHDLNHWFKSLDLNQLNPGTTALKNAKKNLKIKKSDLNKKKSDLNKKKSYFFDFF